MIRLQKEKLAAVVYVALVINKKINKKKKVLGYRPGRSPLIFGSIHQVHILKPDVTQQKLKKNFNLQFLMRSNP
jgi:hypothetical protein